MLHMRGRIVEELYCVEKSSPFFLITIYSNKSAGAAEGGIDFGFY